MVLSRNWDLRALGRSTCAALSCSALVRTCVQALVWLREGGHFFVRESCFHSASGLEAQKKRAFNPTIYRTPLFYSGILQSLSVPADPADDAQAGGGAQAFRFEVLVQRSIQTYIKARIRAHETRSLLPVQYPERLWVAPSYTLPGAECEQ